MKETRISGERRLWAAGKGFTLVELLVAIVVIGILTAIAAIQFEQWTRKSNIERETKELYTDIMSARVTAITRNRNNGIRLVNATQYTTVDDINNDGDYGEAGEVSPNSKTLGNTMNWNGGAFPANLTFDARGLINNIGTMCIFSTVSPGYDCIVISMTRINMGRIINQGGGCISGNCQQR